MLEGTVYSKGTPLEFQFDVYTASVGGKDGTYSVQFTETRLGNAR